MVVKSWKKQHHGRTIYPTEKFTWMNLFKILWVVKWAWLFLTSMEAVRCQTAYSNCTLWHFNLTFSSSHSASTANQKKKKSNQMFTNEISYSFTPKNLPAFQVAVSKTSDISWNCVFVHGIRPLCTIHSYSDNFES